MLAERAYKCSDCGFVATEAQMEADCTPNDSGEAWTNWKCPKCKHWHDDPATPDSGWLSA